MKITKSLMFCLLSMLVLCFSVCNMSKVVDDNDNSSNTNYSATEPFRFDIPVNQQNSLRLDGVNGHISVVGAANLDTAKIWGEKIVKSESETDAAAHLSDVEVVLNQTTSNIFIETKQLAESDGRTYQVNYNLLIPKHWQVQIINVNGIIDVDSLESGLSIAQTNGEIYISEFTGNLDVQLTNGKINARITLPENEECKLSAVNAVIDLNIPKETSASFYASTVNGTVSVTNLNLQNMQSATNFVNGVLGNGQGNINLQTVNGCIAVTGF